MPKQNKPSRVRIDATITGETIADADLMAEQEGLSRSRFIERLIREEKQRRLFSLPLPAKLRKELRELAEADRTTIDHYIARVLARDLGKQPTDKGR